MWESACEADGINALRATWTWAAQEYLLMTEDAEGNTAKWLLRHRWTGPSTLMHGSARAEKRGRGTSSTTFTTSSCPNKTLPTVAPKTRVILMLDEGSVQ